MVDIKIGCKVCGKKMSMDLMKYDPDNRKNLICPECYNAKISKRQVESRTRKVLVSIQDKKPAVMAASLSREKKGPMIEYKCGNCGFRFSKSPLSRISLRCPNCNSEKVGKVRSISGDWVQSLVE